MTARATVLWALVTAPVAALRYVRRALARVLFAAGERCMGAAWRVAPEKPPEPSRAWRPMIVRCVVCGAETPLEEWGIDWDRGGAT